MNTRRFAQEIEKIQQKFPVQYDLQQGWCKVGIYYPPGWDPEKGPILFEVPDNYPDGPPDAYVPAHFRYEGGKPKLFRFTTKSDWYKLCIHPDWDPDNHSTVTWFHLAQEGLENPNASNPWG